MVFMKGDFLIAPRRRTRVDSALRAREQAMVTCSIAFCGFCVTVSRAEASRGGAEWQRALGGIAALAVATQ